jgi:Peptidase inhibitor family I36
MKRFVKKVATLAAVGAAAVGTAVLPAASAHAAPEFPCPRVLAVCTWTEPGGQGRARLLFEADPHIVPHVRSAQNQTPEPWCFYEEADFSGNQRREVSPWETVHDFGFPVRSARPGPCWQ